MSSTVHNAQLAVKESKMQCCASFSKCPGTSTRSKTTPKLAPRTLAGQYFPSRHSYPMTSVIVHGQVGPSSPQDDLNALSDIEIQSFTKNFITLMPMMTAFTALKKKHETGKASKEITSTTQKTIVKRKHDDAAQPWSTRRTSNNVSNSSSNRSNTSNGVISSDSATIERVWPYDIDAIGFPSGLSKAATERSTDNVQPSTHNSSLMHTASKAHDSSSSLLNGANNNDDTLSGNHTGNGSEQHNDSDRGSVCNSDVSTDWYTDPPSGDYGGFSGGVSSSSGYSGGFSSDTGYSSGFSSDTGYSGGFSSDSSYSSDSGYSSSSFSD